MKRRHGNTALASLATPQTELPDDFAFPEFMVDGVIGHLRAGSQSASAKNARRVCRAWRKAHDGQVTTLRLNPSPQHHFVRSRGLHWAGSDHDADLRALASLSLVSLTTLILGGDRSVNRSLHGLIVDQSVTDEGMRALSQLTTLTHLDISQCDAATEDWMRALSPLTALKRLDLSQCDPVGGGRMRRSSPFPALTSPNSAVCFTVTDEGLRALAPLTALTCLNLRGCRRLTAEGVRALAPLISLIDLDLESCFGVSNEVTNEVTDALASLTALTAARRRKQRMHRVQSRPAGPVGPGGPSFYIVL